MRKETERWKRGRYKRGIRERVERRGWPKE